jgi:hypothetical protein
MPQDTPSSPTVLANERSVMLYRCVCGECVAVGPTAGSICPSCRRHIRPDALKSEVAVLQTVQDLESKSAPPSSKGRDHGDAPAVHEPSNEGDPLIGQRLGYFRVIGSIGRGGMGNVYRALDESLQRYVALKVLHAPGGSLSGGTVQHLLQEARAQARVHHPNVVTIYYVGKQKETPFLAMEFVAGRTLADRIEGERIGFGQIIDIAVQVASALGMASRLDMVHGDVKPGNILIQADGTVKLSDFGLARLVSPTSGQTTKISGTPKYLAPEACRGQQIDFRADMYALGIVLFETTFRKSPYTLVDASLQNCLYAHLRASPEFPVPWPADLPERWKEILARLLAKDPAARYATYEALIEDLEAVRPVELPKSGRLLRGLAWVVDLLLISSVQSLMIAPFEQVSARNIVAASPWLQLLAGGLATLAPLAFGWLQARWRTSAGKKLFQVRIVDHYGLSPGRGALFSRAFAQAAPLWIVAMIRVATACGTEGLGKLLGLLLLIALLVDAGFAGIRRDGRSLHDLFFGTRVVLDAPRHVQCESLSTAASSPTA